MRDDPHHLNDPLLLPVGSYGGLSAAMPPDEGSPNVGAGVNPGSPPAHERWRARTAPIEAGAYETP